LLLCLVVETSTHVARYIQVSGAYLNPKWIRLCNVLVPSGYAFDWWNTRGCW